VEGKKEKKRMKIQDATCVDLNPSLKSEYGCAVLCYDVINDAISRAMMTERKTICKGKAATPPRNSKCLDDTLPILPNPIR
jgi:hypothetical protein